MPPAALIAVAVRAAVGAVSLPEAVAVHSVGVLMVGPVGIVGNLLLRAGNPFATLLLRKKIPRNTWIFL